jgi:hypothetical protein
MTPKSGKRDLRSRVRWTTSPLVVPVMVAVRATRSWSTTPLLLPAANPRSTTEHGTDRSEALHAPQGFVVIIAVITTNSHRSHFT